MADPVTWLAIGTVIAVAGAGVSAYGQYQQGKTSNAIASMNAQAAERQASMQLLATQTSAAQARQSAEANFTLRAAEAKARNNNAAAIEQTALMQDGANRYNLRQRREEYGRMQGAQRAAIAASGVAESTGTPLDLLAETAAKIQLSQEEEHYTNEVQRRTLLNEAAMERLGGKLALAGATLDRDSELSAAALRGAAARGEYLSSKRGAEITKLTGQAAQRQGSYAAAGTLLSGAGTAIGGYKSFRTS